MFKLINSVKLIRSLLITLLLVLFYINTSNGKVILIPFIICSISLVLKDLCIMLNKEKFIKYFNKLYVVGFFIFWFGFLSYFSYLSIINKEYLMLLFSIPFWLIGIVIFRKKI